jgi:L-ascorbate metabolism protein UlaG (beta-lactamase superfamily)
MVITYDAVEAVKITQGDITIAINPPSKKSKFSGTSFGSDIVLITSNHPDFNGAENATRKDQEPFVIDGPGEYEVQEFFIRGFASKSAYDGKERVNTIYSMRVDGIDVAFLGALSEKELSPEVKEELGQADILFVPIGGDGVLDAAEAHELAVKREPKIIIPIHYGETGVGEKDALKKFLKEGGQEDTKPVEKLTIKKKEVDTREGDIVVLKKG